MKKMYIKPEMEVQEFRPEDRIMSSVFGSGATCSFYHVVADCDGPGSEYVTFTGPGCLMVSEDGLCQLVVEP